MSVSRSLAIFVTFGAMLAGGALSAEDKLPEVSGPPKAGGLDYVVAVSAATRKNADWAKVVEALKTKHDASVIEYKENVEEILPTLSQWLPRYLCIVATPEDAKIDLVTAAHRLSRKLDKDPYIDVRWGIITGYDAAAAMKMAEVKEPLVIHKIAGGTEIALDACDEGLWYSELKAKEMVRKEKGGKPTQQVGPEDTTKALVDSLNKYQPDAFVTSGHATQKNWMIGYGFRGGQFRCEKGQLYGLDTEGKKYPISSSNPKVYLPIGNCLMGNINSREAMAIAWMNSAGVRQMIGYTVPTWYGYAGWGMLDYFVEQPGRYTLTESFLANNHALVHRLGLLAPEVLKDEPMAGGVSESAKAARNKDVTGLSHDRDVLAFYGDPAWEARMAPGPLSFEQTLTRKGKQIVLEIKPLKGDKSFDPVNKNGSTRGGRPVVAFFPERIGEYRILEGGDLNPVVADDFMLVPLPEKCDPLKPYRVVVELK